MASYTHHAEATGQVDAKLEAIFEFLDDQSNLSAHMSKPSPMLLGTTMQIYMDDDRTRSIGSQFGFKGRVLGVPLVVDEVVVSREPPQRKTWETVAEPRLWVIGRYRMGFALVANVDGAILRVFIEYELPSGMGRILGHAFGRAFARWCTRQMVEDAQRHFHSLTEAPA